MNHSDVNRNTALALDALEAVQAWPEHGHAWWRLVDCVVSLPEAVRCELVALVGRTQFISAQAEWFRQSMLFRLTGDGAWLRRMAALSASLPGADRSVALCVLMWVHALTKAHSKNEFRQALAGMQLVEVLGRLADQFPALPSRPSSPGAALRIAIIAPHLAAGTHAPTDMALNIPGVLHQCGASAAIFALQELSLPSMPGYFAARDKSAVGKADPSTWPVRVQGGIRVELADDDFSLQRRWRVMATKLDAYAPDVVLLVGFFSPFAWALWRRYPVVAMSLHTLPPASPADVWLSGCEKVDPSLLWPELPTPAIAHYPYRFWPAGPAVAKAREAAGVPEDAIVLVSSGSRLEIEMAGPWAEQAMEFLDGHANVHWLLIGLRGPDISPLPLHERVHCFGHQGDLVCWIKMADVYVNPPRMGGGASVAMAMEQAVAVLTLEGSDGGDKAGPMAVADLQTYWQRLGEWVGSRDGRKSAGQMLQRRFHDQFDLTHPRAASALEQACRDAITLFGQRSGAACAGA